MPLTARCIRITSYNVCYTKLLRKEAADAILHGGIESCTASFEVGDEVLELEGDKEKKDSLRKIMWENVSIERTQKGLEKALAAIEQLLTQQIGRLLRLRLLTARCIRITSYNVCYTKLLR